MKIEVKMGANYLSKKLLICLFIFSTMVLGQGKAVWGEIPREQLEMKTYPADTNATALYISDYGETVLNDGLDLVFTRHVRIKILNTNGYEYGTKEIEYYSAKSQEYVKDIQGITYYLNEKGELQSKELDSDDIIREKKTENVTKIKFTMPALSPGCIIEYKYTIVSQSLWDIKDWEFQKREPVLWSEYVVVIPKYIVYTAVRQGYEPFEIASVTQMDMVYSGDAAEVFNSRLLQCNVYHWAVKNAPAVRDEPFMNAYRDNVNSVNIQLSSYAFNGMLTKVLHNWEKVATELRENGYYYEQLKPSGDVTELAKKITNGCSTAMDTVEAIYRWVSNSVTCSQKGGITTSVDDLDELLESKKGNVADVNFLFMAMLRSVGIPCYPVMLSTRSNGKIQDMYPIVSQFNYVVAQVKIGDEIHYLDASTSEYPLLLTPLNILGVKGFLVNETSEEWVVIPVKKKSINRSLAEVEITEDGNLSGDLQESHQNYSAIDLRSSFKDEKVEDVLKEDINLEGSDFSVDSIKVYEKDTVTTSLTIKAKISSPSYVQVVGDMMYINPSLTHKITKSPFKSSVRNFPIVYGYLRTRICEYYITIPAGYEVKEKPGNISAYTEESGLLYTRKLIVDGQKIKVERKFEVKSTELSSRIYESVKNFYDRVLKAEEEVIVLAKKTTIAPPPPAVPEPLPAPSKEQTPAPKSQDKKPGKKK